MSIDFSTVKGLSIPRGTVVKIADSSGNILWKSGYELPASYLNTTRDMTNGNFSSDDGTSSFILSGFTGTYNGASYNKVYVSGNMWIGLGSSSEHIKFNRRDGYINTYYYQVFDTGDSNVGKCLKIRWEGWASYNQRTDAYKMVWEIFLFANGDVFIYLASKGDSTFSFWNGVFQVGSTSYTITNAGEKRAFYLSSGTTYTVKSEQYKK